MRLLFDMDEKDYIENGTVCVRPSIRGIIIKSGKIAMIHSIKYDYYKFPGGGAESKENHFATLIREVKEESGLSVIADSITEYGLVHRVQKGINEDIFVQDNYYYLCDVTDKVGAQHLDDYENEEQFTLEFVTPKFAIETNKYHNHFSNNGVPQFETMIKREAKVLELLIDDGYIK